MTTVKSVFASLALFAAVAVQAQVTPRAIVGQCPSLPSPQQWANGNTQAFNDKIIELESTLSKLLSDAMPEITQADAEQALAEQQRQQQQLSNQAKEMFDIDVNQMAGMSEAEFEAKMRSGMKNAKAESMAQMQKEMAALASLGITEADLKKLEKMNDKQGEAYIKKRLAENGYTEADLDRRMRDAGSRAISDEEWKRQQQNEATGGDLMAAVNTIEAFMEQSKITNKQIEEHATVIEQRLVVLCENRCKALATAQGEAINCVIVRAKGGSTPDCESLQRKADSLAEDYRAEVYRIWSEFIVASQGRLKILLSYAEAADAAKAKLNTIAGTGNAAFDQMQQIENCAISVVGQYLNVTGSNPELKFE